MQLLPIFIYIIIIPVLSSLLGLQRPEDRATLLIQSRSSPITQRHSWAPRWSVLCMLFASAQKKCLRKKWYIFVPLDSLRWLKNKKVSQCCVPSCKSADKKAEKHEFTWEVICDTIGIGTIKPLDDISLCTKHYQQVYYRMLNAKSDARPVVLHRHSSHSCVLPWS